MEKGQRVRITGGEAAGQQGEVVSYVDQSDGQLEGVNSGLSHAQLLRRFPLVRRYEIRLDDGSIMSVREGQVEPQRYREAD